jgi:hypothetical protein
MNGYRLGLVLALASAGFAQTAASPTCTVADSKRAFEAVDKLDNWEAVRRFYNIYLPCDDGGIAEGVSDAVTKLLADKWAGYWRLESSAASPKFDEFILKHIDATVPVEALQSISRNAQRRCPKGFSEACKKINAATLSAIKESEQ